MSEIPSKITSSGNSSKPSIPSNKSPENDEIDLVEIARKFILPYWKWYGIAAFAGAVIATALSYCFTPQYKAEATSLVNVSSSSNLLKGGMGGLKGLASLAGVNLNADDSDTMFNMNYVNSREMEEAFAAKYDLRRELFYKRYDKNGTYKDESTLNRLYTKLLGKNYDRIKDDDVYQTPGPSKETLYKRFGKVFAVNIDQKNMLVTVDVTWKDPIRAKQWANDYIQLANDILRQKAIEESSLKIKYLESQIKERPEVEVQQAIYSLIENEMKQIAVAESTDQFAFRVTQRAFLPERKASPKRWRFLFSGACLGAIAVFAYLIFPRFMAFIKKPKEVD